MTVGFEIERASPADPSASLAPEREPPCSAGCLYTGPKARSSKRALAGGHSAASIEKNPLHWLYETTKPFGTRGNLYVSGLCGLATEGRWETVGNTIFWRAKLASFKNLAEVGHTRFSNFRVYSEQGEPILATNPSPSNVLTDDTGVDLAIDSARSKAVYTLR